MQVLGVQIDKPFLRVAVIEKTRGGISVLSIKSTLFGNSEDVKALYNLPFRGRVVSGLSAKNLLIRPLEISEGTDRHVEETVAFQSEATSHFDPSEILSVPLLPQKGSKKKEALLFTVSCEALRRHFLDLDKWEIDPDRVSATPCALVNYALWKMPEVSDAFLIDLGSSEWTCVWMEQGGLKKSHAIEGGIESLISALWEDRKKILFKKEAEGFAKQIDLLQFKAELNPHLSSQLKEMRQNLAKIIYSFHRTSGPKSVFFTGRTDAFGHLREYLLEGVKELIHGEWNQIVPLEEQKHAVAIGLALEYHSDALQLRRGEFFPQKNWKRVGRFVLCLSLASLLFSTALITFGAQAMRQKQREMIASLQSLVSRWDPSSKQVLFSGDERGILQRWSQTVASSSKDYPYILQAPKVAEVLAWMSHHPLLESMKKEKDPIDIASFHYTLVKFPKMDDLKEPYAAQVEIEFKTTNPLNARKFHEALLKGDECVDASLDVHWESLDDLYRASFYLKNRSSYVP